MPTVARARNAAIALALGSLGCAPASAANGHYAAGCGIKAEDVAGTPITAGLSGRPHAANEVNPSLSHPPRNEADGSGSISAAFGGGETSISLAEPSICAGGSRRL